MSRKLVTIRKIKQLIPIKDADMICIAIIDGWQVIVKKSEFKVGDECLFFEIDSFLPVTDERFAFLKKTSLFNDKVGYRLKTMKMKGVISQGLALPLSMFPEILGKPAQEDYTELLNVVKYDVSKQSSSLVSGNPEGKFPSFIPKTDQERIQNLTSYFETMKDVTFEETLKLDGSSMTCYKIGIKPSLLKRILSWLSGENLATYHFGVCSRNLELKKSDTSNFWSTAIAADIESKLPTGFAIQGELIGPNIQANHEKVSALDYFVFDVFDITNGKYLLPEERRAFCSQHNLQHVPVISVNALPCNMNLEQLLQHVEGESMNPGTISEGRVYKSNTNNNVSFKVISNKYLLKCEK